MSKYSPSPSGWRMYTRMPAAKPSEFCTGTEAPLAFTVAPVGTDDRMHERSGRVRPVRVVISSVVPLSTPSSEMKSPVTGRQAPPRRRSRTIMSTAARATPVVSSWRCCICIWCLLARNMPDVAAMAMPISATPIRSSTKVKPELRLALHFSVDRPDGDILRSQRVAPIDGDGDLLQAIGWRIVQDLRGDGEVAAVDRDRLGARDHVVEAQRARRLERLLGEGVRLGGQVVGRRQPDLTDQVLAGRGGADREQAQRHEGLEQREADLRAAARASHAARLIHCIHPSVPTARCAPRATRSFLPSSRSGVATRCSRSTPPCREY